MFVEAYILAFNEAETIHLTIRHYRQFCDRITIFDNFSTDNTREIAEGLGCEIRPFGIAGVLDDKEYLKVKNHCWKGSNADWVIVCDADEILAAEYQDFKTATFYGRTIFRTNGWNVFSNEMPKNDWLEVKTGVPDKAYSKRIVFNPKEIKEINYVYGCHEFNPVGMVKYDDKDLTLFHYKHVGGVQRVLKRHALYAERRSEFNKRWKLGDNYDDPKEKTIRYFNENLVKSTEYQ